MESIARVFCVSLIAAAVATGIGYMMFSQYGDAGVPDLALGCVGGLIGAIAGATYEIVKRMPPPSSNNQPPKNV